MLGLYFLIDEKTEGKRLASEGTCMQRPWERQKEININYMLDDIEDQRRKQAMADLGLWQGSSQEAQACKPSGQLWSDPKHHQGYI